MFPIFYMSLNAETQVNPKLRDNALASVATARVFAVDAPEGAAVFGWPAAGEGAAGVEGLALCGVVSEGVRWDWGRASAGLGRNEK
jgi:hypothetical protein